MKLAQSTRAPVFLGGTRGFSPMQHRTKHPSCTNPKALMVHGYPIRGRSCSTIAGNTMPPEPLPAAPMARAKLLFVVKYVLSKLTQGQNRNPFPRPQHRPWARKSCQYWVDRDAMKVPKTHLTVPAIITGRKYPASVRRPVKVPMKKRRKTCIDPIQEMTDGSLLSAVT